ncbi:DMT family transporter [Anaerohalosphaeraceae bacterium U12dextr]|jgi:quaternary ammonium compound-resistance protein SugE
MAWVYLFVAGIIEVGWAIGLKYSMGFTRLVPSVLTVLGMVASYVFLSLAVKTLPLGTGYAIWTGIGVAGTALGGIILFSESVNPIRILCLMMILTGILGLKLTCTGQ